MSVIRVQKCKLLYHKIHRSLTAILLVLLCGFLVVGCHPRSHLLEPHITYTPQKRYLQQIGSHFDPLTAEELQTDWGRELKIGISFALDGDYYRAITAFRRSEILVPPDQNERRLQSEYSILLCYYLGKKYADTIEFFEESHLTTVTSSSFPPFRDMLIILYDCYHATSQTEKAHAVLKLIEKGDCETAFELRLFTGIVGGFAESFTGENLFCLGAACDIKSEDECEIKSEPLYEEKPEAECENKSGALCDIKSEDECENKSGALCDIKSEDECEIKFINKCAKNNQQLNFHTTDSTTEDLSHFLRNYNCCKKSVKTAQTLNAILPGAGYYYIGQKKTALTSFIINASFIAASHYFFKQGNWGAGLITTSLEFGWYFGGINGAGLAAKQYNECIYNELGKEFLTSHQLFPVLMLQRSF